MCVSKRKWPTTNKRQGPPQNLKQKKKKKTQIGETIIHEISLSVQNSRIMNEYIRIDRKKDT